MEKTTPKILFLHGALGVRGDLDPLMAIFRERGFEPLAFNFSGHGTPAAVPAEFRIDLFARDLETYLKTHALADVAVFGYSMGGYVALYHAANYADSPLRRIFTYGTKFNWSEKAVQKELPMLVPEHLEEKFPHFVEALKGKHGENWRHLLLATAHMMQNLERLDGLSKEDVADLDLPVTLILGDQDRMVTSEETQLTASWLRHGRVKIVAHSKHELERSNLREIAETVIANLD
jgi:esterase/lipase